jgi:hypothetical protein
VRGFHGGVDMWVVKLTSTGDTVWTKCLGGTGNEFAQSIQQTTDGGYIVAGYTFLANNGDVSGNHGGMDFWVVKLTSTGSITWAKCLGGSDNDIANSVQQTADGGYIVAGSTQSNDGDVSGSHGIGDMWVVKLKNNGDIDWQKCLGGTGGQTAYSIQQTADGGYIIAGNSSSINGDLWLCYKNHGSNDYWIVKIDETGTIQWQKTFGGSGTFDEAQSIRPTKDNSYIVAGYTNSPNNGNVSGNHGSYDFWVVKMGVAP